MADNQLPVYGLMGNIGPRGERYGFLYIEYIMKPLHDSFRMAERLYFYIHLQITFSWQKFVI